MADVVVDAKLTMNIDLIPVVQKAVDVTSVVPVHTQALIPDDAPLLGGYPTPAPLWVRAQTLVSTSGIVLSSGRPEPEEVDLDSDVRFIAGTDYVDPLTGIWTPYQSNRQNWYFQPEDLTNPPELDDLSYLSGPEVIQNTGVRISGGSALLARFNSEMDSMNAFTVSIAMDPNPSTGEYSVLDWHSEIAPPDPGERLALWLNDKIDYFWGANGNSVDQVTSLSKTSPLFLTIVIDPPLISVTASYSTRHSFTTSKVAKTVPSSTWLRWRLGGYDAGQPVPGATSDFSIFEFNFWDRVLTTAEITSVVSVYASIYGVASEWR